MPLVDTIAYLTFDLGDISRLRYWYFLQEVGDLARAHGISDVTTCTRVRKYGGMDSSAKHNG
jgi:hypothetical protein